MAGRFAEELRAEWRASLANVRGEAVLPEKERALFTPAPNAIQWMTRREFLNHPNPHFWWGSWMVIRDFFQLRCPVCNEGPNVVPIKSGFAADTWGRSRMELEDEVLLEWSAAYQEDVCPKCRSTRYELIADGKLSFLNQLHLLCGMRSGKSQSGAVIGTYIEHFLLCMGHTTQGGLRKYLGQAPATPFEITYLASSAVQAQYTVWAIFLGWRSHAPWFARYREWVGAEMLAQASLPGASKWRYEEQVTQIVNEHPDIFLLTNSLNSNSGGIAGRTRPAVIVDEVGRMKNTSGPQGADALYSTAENSLETIRGEVEDVAHPPWFGAMVSVSSPVSRVDKAYRLWQENKDDNEKMYTVKLPTWDFNPKLPRKKFDGAFRKDADNAATSFGADPPGAEHPLIRDEGQFIDVAVDFSLRQRVTFETYEREGKHGHLYTATRMATAQHSNQRSKCVVRVDAGATFDAFSMACAHGELRETQDNEVQWVTVFDWVCRIVPIEGREVYFQSVVDLLGNLAQFFYIMKVRFDRWESTKIIQDIREMEHGIRDCEKHSLTHEHFGLFKQDASMGKIALLAPTEEDLHPDWQQGGKFKWQRDPPHLSPAAAGLYELFNLQRDPATQKVTNPLKGLMRGWNSDDTAQVLVGAHLDVQQLGWTEQHDDRSRRAARKRAEEGGAAWTDRGGIVHPVVGSPRVWGSSKNGRGW